MSYRSSLSKTLGCAVFLALLVSPAVAHNVEVTKNVAGTWHIEPNHSPKAGEFARVWVALTRRGGKILPLAEANCQLSIYSEPRQQADKPVLQPTLQAIAIEQYQGIPGADVVFPKTGSYQLELGCTPKTEGNFQPFQMKYEVTVAKGTTAPAPSSETPSSSQKLTESQETADSRSMQAGNFPAETLRERTASQSLPTWLIPAFASVGILGLVWLGSIVRRRRKR